MRGSNRHLLTFTERHVLAGVYPAFPTKMIAAAMGLSVKQVYQAARRLGLKKSDEYLASPDACRMRRGDDVGKRHRYLPGHVPANKGLRRPGYSAGRMRETQFKKGRPPHESRNYLPIGSLKVGMGVLLRKVSDDPTLYPARRWMPVHRLVWIEANGPVPPGHIVIFRSGQKTLVEEQITLDRLELVSLAENMKRNTYHNRYPAEVKQLIRMRGALTKVINTRSKKLEKQDSGRAGHPHRADGSDPRR